MTKRQINGRGMPVLAMAALIAAMIAAIFMIIAADVYALGVAPSRKVIDYSDQPQTISLRIINNEHKNMRVMVYASGELIEGLKISQSHIMIKESEPEKEFNYTVIMPPDMKPGTSNLSIVISEIPLDTNVADNSQTTIISTSSIIHQLRINVPYAGKYAEGTLYISEGNVGSTVTFTGIVLNQGTDAISQVKAEVVIKGPTNEEIARIKSNAIENMASKTSGQLVVNWKADVNAGVYSADFIVNYDDKQFVVRKTFMVGNYHVDIKDVHVGNFRLGAIAKFDVELVNTWNEPLDGVYGEMQVMDPKGSVLATFKTAEVELKQLSTSTITGYWDTAGVSVGSYDLKVVAHYGEKASERIFKTVVGIDSIDVKDVASIGNVVASKSEGGSMSLLYILVICSIAFNIALFLYFKYMRKKSEP